MNITDKRIDGGKAFDWGKTSKDYAKYRDIYPQEFYEKIISRNLCVDGQKVLDVGTGTGVLPRNMYGYGALWTGADISDKQIEQARLLSENMNIKYIVSSAENIDFPANSFDVITACQCYWYFKHEKTAAVFDKLLKKDGRLVFLAMDWLPFEDEIAGESETLVLKYNPEWSGAGFREMPIKIPTEYSDKFELAYHEEYRINVPFTRESWNGRMKACRGIGASLDADKLARWEHDHMVLLEKIAPEEFNVLHHAAFAELRKK